MIKLKYISFFFILFKLSLNAQTDVIKINASFDFETSELKIKQQITYFNNSASNLDTLYLLNWANGYRNKHTPLAKRLIEDYDKSLYFAKKKQRGRSDIKDISENSQFTEWQVNKDQPDIVTVYLNKPLAPNDSTTLVATYVVKLPDAVFTGYGKNETSYNLRYWYLVPAVFDSKWHTLSNLNLDDFYMNPTNYDIELKLPEGVRLNTDLSSTLTTNPPFTTHKLVGTNRVDLELNIALFNDFNSYKTDSLEVISNLNGTALSDQVKSDVVNRQVAFIQQHLGSYPHEKMLVNKISYTKNPIYGLNQLPKALNPFSGVFEWDIKMFKVLTKKYIENTLLVNPREDYWLTDGIQTYLMMQYVEKFYPEIKAMGNISKIWGVRTFNIAKLEFNGKYPFVYQFAARNNLDQALNTRADSLSNFNRKIVNKYKAGIGLRYLDEYLQDSIVPKSIKQLYIENKLSRINSNVFKNLVVQKSTKDLNWFFGDYIQSKKKIDYTIKKISKSRDSVAVTIKNKRNFSAPIALYGVDKNEIKFKKWLTNIDSTTTIKIPKGDFTKLSLNYEYLYPELNLRDNWKNMKGIFNKPIQFRFFKDLENPYYNQVFYNLYSAYNLYDGILLGPRLYNESLFKKKWLYKITPIYGFRSKSLNGSLSFVYQHLPEDTNVYKFIAGLSASNFHYDEDLSYMRFSPFVSINFKRESLRDVGGKALTARYLIIDRETLDGAPKLESDSYNIFNVRFGASKPDIIQDIRYTTDFQLSNSFSKLSFDFRYRKLTDANRQYDLRLYAGTFLHNKSEGDFFSFSLDRPSDYLFDYDYLGRSEKSGFFSQQIIISEGGFKSQFQNNFANRWIVATNGSVSIWKWLELYADGGFYKNKGQQPLFKYDSGIRLNFIHNILEVYFPLQSSLGFEPTLPNYNTKIRFVLTLDPGKIINFAKRGFF